MGFGGGGSGSFVLPDHTHTNAIADGGDLEDLVSLVDGATLQAWFDAEFALVKPVYSKQTIVPTTAQTTTSTSLVDMTAGTLTLPTRTGGLAYISLNAEMENSTVDTKNMVALKIDTVDEANHSMVQTKANISESASTFGVTDLDGGSVVARWKTSAGTVTLRQTALISFEVGGV